ncbi:MAG: hydrogenase maturation protease [Bacillota bacterium]
MAKKILVLGLGNTILTDDGVGIYAARELRKMIDYPNVSIMEASLAGLQLLDLVAGYDTMILIDSIKLPGGKIGEIYRIEAEALRSTVRLASIHDINFATAMEFGRLMGLQIPSEIEIFAVCVADTETFGEKCTPAVEMAVPKAARILLERLREHLEGKKTAKLGKSQGGKWRRS